MMSGVPTCGICGEPVDGYSKPLLIESMGGRFTVPDASEAVTVWTPCGHPVPAGAVISVTSTART